MSELTMSLAGQTYQTEKFAGQEKMGEKTEQMYLSSIWADAKHNKNIFARKNKSKGIRGLIMDILKSTYSGKYFFEVPLVS
jgi:hypothetical protein